MPDADGGGRGDPEYLIVGHMAKPHGTKGELFVWPLTERPSDTFAPGRLLYLGDGEGGLEEPVEALVVERARPFKRGQLVKFTQRDDRNAVAELVGRYLLLPLAELAPLAEDEVFYHQLLGMAVVTVGGDLVGQVREVYETDPADLLEVRAGDGRLRLIPFTKRVVKAVDVVDGRMVIDPPAGLLEL